MTAGAKPDPTGYLTPLQERQLRARGGLASVPSADAIERLRHEIKALEYEIRDATTSAVPTVPDELAPVCIALPLTGMEPGVYMLLRAGVVVYVGSSIVVSSRVGQHVQERGTPAGKDFDSVSYIPCKADERLSIEGALIRLLAPEYNGNAPASDSADHETLAALGVTPHPMLGDLCGKRAQLAQMRRDRMNALYAVPQTRDAEPNRQKPAPKRDWHPEFRQALDEQRKKQKR